MKILKMKTNTIDLKFQVIKNQMSFLKLRG